LKVLVITQYFWPESFIINQLATTLATQGHELVVLTGKPNYPEGKVYQGYQEQGTLYETMGEVEVIRVPLRPRKSGNAKALLLNYLSFIWSGLIRFPFLLKGREFDVIFVFAPSPITSAIPAIPLRYLKRAHLAIWVQDLWPESLSATGFIKNKLILKLIRYLVKGIYAFSDTLLVQSKAFIEPVSALSNQQKTIYFPNVINDMKQGIDETKSLLPAYLKECLENYFCLVFAGNIGKAQSIETLISAAEQLDILPEVRIIIVGSGSRLAWAKEKVERRGITNIIFTGSFPVEVMPPIFSKAKALLVSLNAEEIFSYTIPSKVQSYMSAGRPIIASINGEAARVIEEAEAGLTCPAEEHESLAARIIQFFNMPENERDIIGDNGRRYFLENFEMQQQSKKLIEILEQRIDLKRASSK
jgi:glycosyltransferase involved in cell wall biosynthesis